MADSQTEQPQISAGVKSSSPSFDATTLKTSKGDTTFPISNVAGHPTLKGLFVVSMSQISERVHHNLRGWPRRAAGRLFALHNGLGPKTILFLDSPDELFSWFRTSGQKVMWADPTTVAMDPDNAQVALTPISRKEFFIHLRSSAEPNYNSVEEFPHEPRLPNTFYLDTPLPEPTGEALKEIVKRFNPKQPIDRFLFQAALITSFWGGPAGTRPAFVLAAKDEQDHPAYGVGKTSTADLFVGVIGGALKINEADNWGCIQKALMNDHAMSRRAVLLDNLQAVYSCSGLASLITSTSTFGHTLYAGYRERPNYLTIIITANVPKLSEDLVDRAVILQMGGPKHKEPGWKEWSERFVKECRLDLIADILAFLKQKKTYHIESEYRSRWESWEAGVLSLFPDANEMAKRIKELRPLWKWVAAQKSLKMKTVPKRSPHSPTTQGGGASN